MLLLTIITALLTQEVTSYQVYQTVIPNGDRVPHPCKVDQVWNGVGHKIPGGTGNRNPFGITFEMNGKAWTREICQADSDGDGFSNGHELGDPDCSWTPGSVPKGPAVSHPGVCEPWNSAKCRQMNEWILEECQKTGFTCPATEEPGVFEVPVRLLPTLVPNKKTTYACIDYMIPQSGDYHLVATTPILNNTNVVHHMLLFGCDTARPDQDFPYPPGTVYECNMQPNHLCTKIISLWSYGLDGDCVHDLVGFRMGTKGFQRVSVQAHWNNQFGVANYTDSSGMTLFLSPNRREEDAGVLVVGSNGFQLPAGVTSLPLTGRCSPKCTTRSINESINVVWAFNHMHYLGRSMKVELIREDDVILLGEDPVYDYDSPTYHRFADPVNIRPGDEIRTTCIYNTTSTNETTYFGEATSDEMCFAFLAFYPESNLLTTPYCISWRSLPYCELFNGEPIDGCDYGGLFSSLRTESIPRWYIDAYEYLQGNCSNSSCLVETCPSVISMYEQCLSEDMVAFIGSRMQRMKNVKGLARHIKIHSLMTSCNAYTSQTTTSATSAASVPMMFTEVIIVPVTFILWSLFAAFNRDV